MEGSTLFDLQRLLSEAHSRRLKPDEIRQMLQNHHELEISKQPPCSPCSGSVYFFDRRVTRYFRNDGHNWKKRRNGKTINEAHVKLNVGNDPVLNCYYVSGEENPNFQRRCYSLLEPDLMHIVFVHYLDAKKGREEVERCNWSCMFGEVEVPAEVITDGVLCCHSPPHDVARVPFYITNSNRLACSEVREFDYQAGLFEDVDISDISGNTTEFDLLQRLERLLSDRSSSSLNCPLDGVVEKRKLIGKLMLLKEEDKNCHVTDSTNVEEFAGDEVKKQLLENRMKEKLYSWLLHKVTESGNGPCVLDDDGQGVLHLVAALGFEWAIKPTVSAGVTINFRDVKGWTALHWAAFFGREQTVAVLVSLGASTGLLTDPSPENPLGRTPADLASGNGHKGISGFLAQSSLACYLKDLTVNDPKDDGSRNDVGPKAVQKITERTATPLTYDVKDELSHKDSLAAVRNATQAGSRIYQVFRVESFHGKQLADHGYNKLVASDEYAVSLIASKTYKSGHCDGIVYKAAVQIQKNYRSWKKRKEFLLIRERIVKIQALVRGHQVRKKYNVIKWSVGILEKISLRWRHKRSGLRGFCRDALTKEPNPGSITPKEDDYDFLKEGRIQNEERIQHALTRVRSMIHYPEGRAQYRRLLTVVEGFREAKESEMVVNNPEERANGDEDHLICLDCT